MISGKGMYLWNLKDCEGGDPISMAEVASQAGLQYVLIKIADGCAVHNLDTTMADPGGRLKAAIKAFKAKGIIVWGWQYVYGFSPDAEAAKAIERVKTLGLSGFVVNAEYEYKNKSVQAVRYMNALRSGLPGVTLGLSSYRFPSLHREFPWFEFINRADVIMPQVYWILGHNPGTQLRKCIEEYRQYPIRPMIPTGAAFVDNQNVDPATGEYWRPTADQVQEFIDKAMELGCLGFNFWEWSNTRKHCPELWTVISAFGGQNPPVAPDLLDSLEEIDDFELEEETEVHTIEVQQLTPTSEVESWLFVRTAPGIHNPAVEKILPGDTVFELGSKTMPDGSIWVRVGHRQWAAKRYRIADGGFAVYLS